MINSYWKGNLSFIISAIDELYTRVVDNCKLKGKESGISHYSILGCRLSFYYWIVYELGDNLFRCDCGLGVAVRFALPHVGVLKHLE
jgi:hypothetical protein